MNRNPSTHKGDAVIFLNKYILYLIKVQKIFLLLYISERNALHIILQYKKKKKHATEVLL